MRTEFKREQQRNYMIVWPEGAENEDYTVKMLSGNSVPGLIPLTVKRLDGQLRYCYDITSKQPLDRILQGRSMSGTELSRLMAGLLFTVRQTERYLLDENRLCLEPEFIYAEPDLFQCYWCLLPGQKGRFADSFRKLAQYLLDRVDRDDSEAVLLAFGIFRQSRKENFGMEDIEGCLQKTRLGNRTEGEKPEVKRWSETERNWRLETKQRTESEMNWWPEAKQDRRLETKQRTESELNRWPEPERQSEPKSNQRLEAERWLKSEGEKSESGNSKPEFREKRRKPVLFRDIRWIFWTAAAAFLILLPFGIWLAAGSGVLLRYRWQIAAAEAFAAAALFLFPLRGNHIISTEASEKEDPEAKLWADIFPETEHVFLGANYEADFGADLEADLETDPEEYPEDDCEIQTMLLTARPVRPEGRRLSPVSGGEEIGIRYFPFIIGKSRSLADHRLDEPGISRLHLRFDKTENGYSATDLNSTNGTVVNGRMLEANETCPVVPGDEIMIADRVYRFL